LVCLAPALQSVDDFRHASGDVVGQSRPRNLVDAADKAAHPPVFGRPSRGKRDAGDWSAADCLRGDYSAEEIAPDADLGRSVPAAKRAGAAAAASHLPHPDRRFGMPSIRTDVPTRHGQSLASTTDFGTGTGAGQLLTPSPYAEHGVDETDFVAPRSAPELRDLFGRIGHRLTDPEFAAVYRRVRDGMECVLVRVGAQRLGGCARLMLLVWQSRDRNSSTWTWGTLQT